MSASGALVPTHRLDPAATPIQSGKNVSASVTMEPLAELAHWIAGGAYTLVPACCPNLTIASGASRDFKFWCKPLPATTRIAWVFQIRGTSATSTLASHVAITTPVGGTSVTYELEPPRSRSRPVVQFEDWAAKSTGEQEVSVAIAPTGSGCVVESIACWAVPRAVLAQDTVDYGMELARFGVGQPIHTGTVGDLATRPNTLRTIGRRVGLYDLGLPDNTADAIQVTTASPSFQSLLPLWPSILDRLQYLGDTTGTISYRVRYATTVGGAGNFKITAASGATDTVALPASVAFTWTATRTLAFDCEDLTASDGRRSSRWDEATLQANQTAGTVYISQISIFTT